MFKKIAIVGVGLIGGSIGITARKKNLAEEVIGIGRRRSSIKKATAIGAIDKGGLDIERGVKEADLVIIATPVDKVMTKIKEAAGYLRKGAIIMDVNSTKEEVVRYADSIMPEGVYFVGSHPIAGSEESGVLSACPDLFKDTVCILTPSRYTEKKALDKIKRFWERLGAKTELFTPAAHDRIVARISHLPHLLSFCLCATVSSKEVRITGPGFRDTTRIAKSSPHMWSDIFLQNRENLLRSVTDFERNLKKLKSDIRKKRRLALINRLNQARRRRDSIG